MDTVILESVIRNEPIMFEPLLHGGLCEEEIVAPASPVNLFV